VPYELEDSNNMATIMDNFVTNDEIDSKFHNGITNEVFDQILQLKLTLTINNLYYLIINNITQYYYLISNRYYNATNLSPIILTQ
jgi:hypothetical protein